MENLWIGIMFFIYLFWQTTAFWISLQESCKLDPSRHLYLLWQRCHHQSMYVNLHLKREAAAFYPVQIVMGFSATVAIGILEQKWTKSPQESRWLKKHKMFWSLKYHPMMLNPISVLLFYYLNNGFFLKYQEVVWTMAVAAYCEGGIHCICEKCANNSNKIL